MRNVTFTKVAIAALVAAVVIALIMVPNKVRQGTAVGGGTPNALVLHGIARDFRREHPDFDVLPVGGFGHYAGNVEQTLDALNRPAFTGAGFKVATQWRDGDSHPIAPNLYNVTGGTTECSIIPGITADGLIDIANQAVVDSFSSLLGPYGGANVGQEALIVTNAIGPDMLRSQNSSEIHGDVLVGPGGDPNVVFATHPNCVLTGTLGALDAPIPMPDVSEPTWLGPSLGDVVYNGGTVVISEDLHVDRWELLTGSIQISGDVTILCESDCIIQGGGITLLPDSSLRLYVKQAFVCAAAPINMNTGDPSRARIFSLGTQDLRVEGNSALVMARFFAPDAKLHITQGSAVYGTFVGNEIDIENQARFHVDTALSGPVGGATDTAGTSGTASAGGIQSAESFSQWFRDVPGVSLSRVHSITLPLGADGYYEYDTASFHPIDGMLLGNENDGHNYFLTYSINATFVYLPCTGQMIEFEGDDDAWVFIDGKLAMDRGGVMPGTEQYVDVDRLGLSGGQTYSLLFLYAQRQEASAAFRLRTNIPLSTQGAIPVITDQYD